ncbi:sulfatase [Vicingaceae bacterium]|nr:sulfatase [Vicingaceae bacterium]
MKNQKTWAVLGIFLLFAGSTVADEQKTNIVFILADDLGWADVSTGLPNLGNESDFYETPNLERLAKEGVSFTNVHVQPNCAPTRAAILSGQYSARSGNGVYNVGSLNRGGKRSNGKLVPPEQNQDIPTGTFTLPQGLATVGYVTAHFGKYHVGGHEGGESTLPQNQGFDFNYGGGAAGHPNGYHAKLKNGRWSFGGRTASELNEFAAPYNRDYVLKHHLPASLAGTPKHLSDAMCDAFAKFVTQDFANQKERPTEAPFYAQIWLYSVHTPIQPSPDMRSHFASKKNSAPSKSGHDNPKYAGLVGNMDRAVGRVLRTIEDPNGDGDTSDSIAGHTLVVFCSDNGGARQCTSNRPLRRAKGTFYEGGIRVPMIVRSPGNKSPGGTNNTLIHAVDFFPTFMELAENATYYRQLDGKSFAKAIQNPKEDLHREPIFYHFPGYLDDRAEPCSAVIKKIGDEFFKLIYYYEEDRSELYNLSRDIGETNDLAASDDVSTIAAELMSDIRNWLDQTDPDWKPVFTKTSDGKAVTFPED